MNFSHFFRGSFFIQRRRRRSRGNCSSSHQSSACTRHHLWRFLTHFFQTPTLVFPHTFSVWTIRMASTTKKPKGEFTSMNCFVWCTCLSIVVFVVLNLCHRWRFDRRWIRVLGTNWYMPKWNRFIERKGIRGNTQGGTKVQQTAKATVREAQRNHQKHSELLGHSRKYQFKSIDQFVCCSFDKAFVILWIRCSLFVSSYEKQGYCFVLYWMGFWFQMFGIVFYSFWSNCLILSKEFHNSI